MIKPGMKDSERYSILKTKRIKVVKYSEKLLVNNIADLRILEGRYRKEANKILKPLARKLGLIKRYNKKEIELEFNYSNNNLDESTKKQTGAAGNDIFVNFAKMLSCFEELINNAVLIEIHRDDAGHIEAPNFIAAYVLLAVFSDGEFIVPVKFLVKEFDRMDNVLYVTITLQKINEAEVLGQRTATNEHNSPRSAVYISLADFLSEINDETMKKYLPEQFFETYIIKDDGSKLCDHIWHYVA